MNIKTIEGKRKEGSEGGRKGKREGRKRKRKRKNNRLATFEGKYLN